MLLLNVQNIQFFNVLKKILIMQTLMERFIFFILQTL